MLWCESVKIKEFDIEIERKNREKDNEKRQKECHDVREHGTREREKERALKLHTGKERYRYDIER